MEQALTPSFNNPRGCLRRLNFHRVRDSGLLHPRRSAPLRRIQLMLQVRLPPREPDAPRASWRCPHCGGTLRIIATRLPPHPPRRTPQIHAGRSQIM
jgi:hypothetical protein